jgi:hypothetical protein
MCHAICTEKLQSIKLCAIAMHLSVLCAALAASVVLQELLTQAQQYTLQPPSCIAHKQTRVHAPQLSCNQWQLDEQNPNTCTTKLHTLQSFASTTLASWPLLSCPVSVIHS